MNINRGLCSGLVQGLRNPYAMGTSVTLSYVLLYTSYDKATKNLKFSNLLDFFLCRRGIDWTLVEANKAISLSGLTNMLLCFIPNLLKSNEDNSSLLRLSMNMLWVHSIYSFGKFYQWSPLKIIKDKPIKRLSVLLGIGGQLALASGFWRFIGTDMFIVASTMFGVAHFWTMEVDYKYVLQVRPYAYLPFPLAAWVAYGFFSTQ